MAVFSFLIAFTVGVGVAFLCYLVSRLFIKKRSAFYTASTVIRQVVCVCFLVALFFVGQKTSLDSKLLLIGGALGVTLPSFFFTSRLVRLSDSINGEENTKMNEKGDDNG